MKPPPLTDNPTDAELLRDFAAHRDAGAFASLVERHAGMVLGVALRRLGGGSGAEDAMQEVFILLAQKAASLRPGDIGPWLHRVTVNVCRNHARREKKQRDILLRVGAGKGSEKETSSAEAASSGGREDAWALLDAAVNTLPDRQRRVVLMRFYERRPWRDIGLASGKSEDAARVLCGRAVERLGRLLRRRGALQPLSILTAGLGSLAGKIQAMPPGFTVETFTRRVLAGDGLSTVAAGQGFWSRWGAAAACFAGGAGLPVLLAQSEALPNGGKALHSAAPLVRTAAPGGAARAVEEDPLSADELIRLLRSLRPWGNPVPIRIRVQRAMAALSDEDFPRVKDAWLAMRRTRQWYEAGEALFQRWGALDYHAAVAAVREHELEGYTGRVETHTYSFNHNAQDGWMSSDPAAFLAYQAPAAEDVRQGEAGGKAGRFHTWDECLRLADGIADSRNRERFLWNAAESRLPRDRAAITAWAEENDSGSAARFWSKWLQEWGWRDPAAAWEHAGKKWPDAANSPWPGMVTRYWAQRDAAAAAAAIAAFIRNDTKADRLRRLMGDWIDRDPGECLSFLRKFPSSPARDALFSDLEAASGKNIQLRREGSE